MGKIPSLMYSTRRSNHTGSYDGVRSTILRTRWQIFGMLTVGGGIIALFIYLSLTK
jgi:hypothetical protein